MGKTMAAFGIAITMFFLIAGPWYFRNFHEVSSYLMSYGYGSYVAEYDHQGSALSWVGFKLRVLGYFIMWGYFIAVS